MVQGRSASPAAMAGVHPCHVRGAQGAASRRMLSCGQQKLSPVPTSHVLMVIWRCPKWRRIGHVPGDAAHHRLHTGATVVCQVV